MFRSVEEVCHGERDMIAQVRTGMEVRTADGQKLGKVTQVWYGAEPTAAHPRCDEDICSRLEVQRRALLQHHVLYVPSSALAAVTADQVALNVDAATVNERDWLKPPQWIAGAGSASSASGIPAGYLAGMGTGSRASGAGTSGVLPPAGTRQDDPHD